MCLTQNDHGRTPRSIYARNAVLPTFLFKTKKEFQEDVAKKQPDLALETVCDGESRPEMVLVSVTPKWKQIVRIY